jgi:hypothetical protein
LQMRYRASGGKYDECRIAERIAGNVRQILEQLISASVQKAVVRMISNIYNVPLAFDLMSIDPKEADDVFGSKRWSVLGKVAIPPEQIGNQLDFLKQGIDFSPIYTARSFTPRLAVSAGIPRTFVGRLFDWALELRRVIDHVPPTPLLVVFEEPTWFDQAARLFPYRASQPVGSCSLAPLTVLWPGRCFTLIGPRHKLVLLMSFESRLAELYLDGNSQGFCALAAAWTKREKKESAAAKKLPIAIAVDQLLNEILVAAGKPLKPKTTSSNN